MKRALLVLALAPAACSSPPPAPTTCTPMVGGTPPALAQPLLVLEHSETAADIASIIGNSFVESPPDPALGTDQNLLTDGQGGFYVGVNDDGSLHIVDPRTRIGGTPFSVYPDHPASSIPHGIYGIAVDASGNLWVSRDDVNEVAIFTPDGKLSGTVDLGSLDPDEHHPDMNGILIVGTKAYVALGFLTHVPEDGGIFNDTARRPGMIAIIDTTSRAIVGQIDLVGHNPVHRLIPIDQSMQKIIVATPGQHNSVDPGDGIDFVDLAAGKATQLISETELGGSIDEVVWAGPDEAYAITQGPVPSVNPTSLIRFDPQTGQVTQPPLARAPSFCDSTKQGYVHVGLALDGDLVAIGDHTSGASAVRVFSRAAGAELPSFYSTVAAPWGLLPFGP